MIVLHLLQLNGSVNYYNYKKWKLISSEVGVKLQNRENSKSGKKNKIVVQIYWTHVPCIRLRAPLAQGCLQGCLFQCIGHWHSYIVPCPKDSTGWAWPHDLWVASLPLEHQLLHRSFVPVGLLLLCKSGHKDIVVSMGLSDSQNTT